jgi:hypothetical protein
MISPGPDDIGRLVIYREAGTHLGRKIEEGVLTSFNQQHAFVRYSGLTSAATNFADLEWSKKASE